MNYYIQGSAARAEQIKAAFEKLGYDVSGFDMCNDNILFFTYKLQGGGKVISTTNANLYTANIIKTHPDYQELELPIETKPKFKVGDWIANDYCAGKVIALTDDAYLLDSGQGIPFSCEHNAHLWTIEDAKDGDVLAADECYVIFKEIDGLNIKCYCTYHYMGFNPSFHIDTLQNKAAFNPATKEQRDTLFAKMKEYGYEWDEKKKELHKIINPKFKVGDWITNGTFTHYIVSIVDGFYYFYGGGYLDFGKIDGYYHLWTIADAKDGDVLARNWHEDGDSWEKIIIFKNYHTKGVKGLFKNPCVEGYGNTFKNGKLAFREEVPYYSKTWTDNLQPATVKQRDLLFQKMKENGCEWDAEKKELRKIKPHYNISNFNPFQKVLVRDADDGKWMAAFYSHYMYEEKDYPYQFATIGTDIYGQCIPFEGNEHLLGTIDPCDEQYINW